MPFQLNADIQWPLIMASGFAKLKSLPVAQAKIWRTDGDVPEHVAAAFTSLCIISTYSEPFDDICNYIGVLENTTEQLKSLELNANTTFNGNKTEISMDGRGLRDLCIRLVASQQDFTNPMPFKLAFKHSDDSLKKLQSLNVESNHDFCMAGLTNTLVNAHDHLLSLRMLGGTTKTLRPNMHFPHLMKLNLAFPLADATIENMPPNDALIRNITKFVGNNSRVLSRLALAGRIMFEDMELQVDDIPNWIDLWLNAIEMHRITPPLVELTLHGSSISDMSLPRISTMFGQTLTELNLSRIKLGWEWFKFTTMPLLELLKVDSCHTSPNDHSFERLLAVCPNLTSLEWIRNTPHAGNVFVKHENLIELNIDTDIAVDTLILDTCPQLIELFVCHGTHMYELNMDCIGMCPKMYTLDVSSTLDYDCVKSLAIAVSTRMPYLSRICTTNEKFAYKFYSTLNEHKKTCAVISNTPEGRLDKIWSKYTHEQWRYYSTERQFHHKWDLDRYTFVLSRRPHQLLKSLQNHLGMLNTRVLNPSQMRQLQTMLQQTGLPQVIINLHKRTDIFF